MSRVVWYSVLCFIFGTVRAPALAIYNGGPVLARGSKGNSLERRCVRVDFPGEALERAHRRQGQRRLGEEESPSARLH